MAIYRRAVAGREEWRFIAGRLRGREEWRFIVEWSKAGRVFFGGGRPPPIPGVGGIAPEPRMVTPQTWMAGGGPGRDVTSRVMQRVGGRANMCAAVCGKAEVSPVYGALLGSPAIYRRAVGGRGEWRFIAGRLRGRGESRFIAGRLRGREEWRFIAGRVRPRRWRATSSENRRFIAGRLRWRPRIAIYCGMASTRARRMAIYRRAAGVQRPEAQSPDQAVSLTSPQRCFLNGKPAYAARRPHGRIALVINS